MIKVPYKDINGAIQKYQWSNHHVNTIMIKLPCKTING